MPRPPRLVTANGTTLPLQEWAARTGIPAETIRQRLDEFGWPPERAVGTPPQAKFRGRTRGRPRADVPRPCPVPRDKAGQAVVEWEHLGKRYSRRLGPWGSPEAAVGYRRLAAEWAAHGPTCAAPGGGAALGVTALVDRWLAHCSRTYVKGGKPTTEPANCLRAARPLVALYGDRPAAEFGPVELAVVRQAMVDKGWVRRQVNIMVSRLVGCWKWGVSQGLVPVATWQALTTLAGLKKGRGVPDRPKRRPPADADVAKLLAWLDAAGGKWPVLAALVRAQALVGCRPGELCAMEAGQVDRTPGVWRWTVPGDKSEHLDRGEKWYPVGPQAQAVLAPLLDRHPAGPVWRWPGKGTPVTREEYGKQLGRACRRAGVPAFTPHQLRHLLATRVARHYQSLDHAAAAIGDTPAMAAAVYVHLDPDERRKIDVARELG